MAEAMNSQQHHPLPTIDELCGIVARALLHKV
jgi:hypothetical protein